MTPEELGAQFARLTQQEKLRLLLDLSHNLTVAARDAYFQGEVDKPDKLVGANEFQHRLTRMALDIIDGTTFMKDDEIAEYLLVGFAELGATNFLEDSVKRIPPR